MRTLTVLKFMTVITGTASYVGTADGQQLLAGEREARVTAIPNVVAADARWELVWAGFETADGIVGTPDAACCLRRSRPTPSESWTPSAASSCTSRTRMAPARVARRTLYVPQLGAVGPDGKAWKTPQGVRNTAMTIYAIRMLAERFRGRPK